MLRRLGAAAAVLAFACGFSAAPHTHVHHAIDSVSDERHPPGQTLIHTHASPHSHHDGNDPERRPAGNEDSHDQIWSVDSFVFQQAASSQAPSVVLVVFGEPHVQLNSIWSGADRLEPMAHGPPVGPPSGLRGPPVFLPTFA